MKTLLQRSSAEGIRTLDVFLHTTLKEWRPKPLVDSAKQTGNFFA